ncbi:MAG TPA: site-specific DNA-methyltransferase [Rhodanobacteraceae bacterium]
MTANDDPTLEAASTAPQDLLRAQLRALAPEAFSEGKLDVAALKRALGEANVADAGERYRLDWAGKSDAYRVLQAPSTATLRPQRDKSVNFDAAQHVFIEGENLEVLKVLQKAYFGKVKLIYIDPPYNTGSDSFIYPDRFQESKEDYLRRINELADDGTLMREGFFRKNSKENGHYHSNWLSMMLPRLYIARNLLREDGVIFVSCDDNEVHNLRALMNEVFGEDNFAGEIARATGTPTGQGTGQLVNEKDYILAYTRSGFAEFNGLAFDEEDERKYDQADARGRYLIRPLRKTGGEDRREDRPTMYFEVKSPDGTPVFPVGPGGYESRWRCGPTTYAELFADGMIEWRQSADGDWKPYQKFYLEGRLKQASNLWTDIEGNKKASRDLSRILGGKYFDHPKPVELLKVICLLSAKDGIVLDFFAGSGTTAQAVTELNHEDGDSRRFVLVQLPELVPAGSAAAAAGYSTIAEIGRERIAKAMDVSGVEVNIPRQSRGL